MLAPSALLTRFNLSHLQRQGVRDSKTALTQASKATATAAAALASCHASLSAQHVATRIYWVSGFEASAAALADIAAVQPLLRGLGCVRRREPPPDPKDKGRKAAPAAAAAAAAAASHGEGAPAPAGPPPTPEIVLAVEAAQAEAAQQRDLRAPIRSMAVFTVPYVAPPPPAEGAPPTPLGPIVAASLAACGKVLLARCEVYDAWSQRVTRHALSAPDSPVPMDRFHSTLGEAPPDVVSVAIVLHAMVEQVARATVEQAIVDDAEEAAAKDAVTNLLAELLGTATAPAKATRAKSEIRPARPGEPSFLSEALTTPQARLAPLRDAARLP